MGCTSSSEESGQGVQASSEVYEEVQRERTRASVKLLLLGAGSSGKTTLVRQMKVVSMSGFAERQLAVFATVIRLAVLRNMRALVLATDAKFQAAEAESMAQALRLRPLELTDAEEMPAEQATGLVALWRDAAIQQVWAGELQVDDNAAYFFDDLERIASHSYVPTTDDILRLRVRTVGVEQTTLTFGDRSIEVVDVGGQKTERKKWVHAFHDVTAMVFVVACSEYDLQMEEDASMNRMQDALRLFSDSVNSRWFIDKSVIVLLNKTDIFARKIVTVPLSVAFPDYKGENTYDDGMRYLQSVFRDVDRASDREMFFHATCATDTSSIGAVLEAIADTVLRAPLKTGGVE